MHTVSMSPCDAHASFPGWGKFGATHGIFGFLFGVDPGQDDAVGPQIEAPFDPCLIVQRAADDGVDRGPGSPHHHFCLAQRYGRVFHVNEKPVKACKGHDFHYLWGWQGQEGAAQVFTGNEPFSKGFFHTRKNLHENRDIKIGKM
jgi:hypothetical protein